jgi:PAS domain S-box-containing protein
MTAPAPDRRSNSLETRWRQVLEATAEAYLALDGDGRVVDWNPAATGLFGLSRQDAVGTPAARLVVQSDRSLLVTALRAAVERSPGTGAPPLEVEVLSATGRLNAEWTVWGVDRRGGTVVHCFVRDISVRYRTQRTAALLAAVVEGSADAIITESVDGRIRTWNPAAERTFGWAADDAIGATGLLVVPPTHLQEHRRLRAEVLAGEPVRGVESERITRSGEMVPVSLRMSPVRDPSGAVVAVSTTARDTTEQRWMATTLDSTLEQLQVAVQEARLSEESARRFLADAAHQLRTPLAGARACAELLLLGAAATDRDKLLATMVRETSRAGRLITALLRIARLDQGEPLPAGEVDLLALCRDEVERLSVLAPHLQVRLEPSAAPEGPLPLDAGSCQEIVGNLGDNAVRHAATAVVVTVGVSDGQVRVRVSDDGPGVPVDARDRVFERFVSLDGKGGSGLGLPIARGLARAMGGDLRYDDGFLLTLPLTGSAGPSG